MTNILKGLQKRNFEDKYMDNGYLCCKSCKEQRGLHIAFLCVNKECTIYRCANCGKGIDIDKLIELKSTRKK